MCTSCAGVKTAGWTSLTWNPTCAQAQRSRVGGGRRLRQHPMRGPARKRAGAPRPRPTNARDARGSRGRTGRRPPNESRCAEQTGTPRSCPGKGPCCTRDFRGKRLWKSRACETTLKCLTLDSLPRQTATASPCGSGLEHHGHFRLARGLAGALLPAETLDGGWRSVPGL